MFKKLYYIFIFLFSLVGILLGFHSTIIPKMAMKFVIIFYLIILLLMYILISRKKKFIVGIGVFLSILLIIINSCFVVIYFKSNSFFNKITNIEYERSSYSVLVLNDSDINKIDELKEIGIYYNDMDNNYEKALDILNNKIKVDNKKYDNIFVLVNDLINNKIEAIFINDNYIDIIDENNGDFINNIKILDTINVDVKSNNENNGIDINNVKSFNIYISGIDTYGEISTVSRSDVNILASINMVNNKILLTNTPRDYYVQLAGTTGMKDKLTHAGVYGINTSIGTLENLYDTDINYYVRVNFNSLIKLVDSIGGIDVYSDQDLTTLHYKVNVKKGWNHFNGEQALGYSRERYSYVDGDRHRGRNQQQVIEAIIKKVTKSRDINTYLSLFNTIEDNFQTNIDKKMINSFINLQVKNNYNWNVESISVTGYDSSNYTYSFPGQLLYVMEPDINSLEDAKNKIKETLE